MYMAREKLKTEIPDSEKCKALGDYLNQFRTIADLQENICLVARFCEENWGTTASGDSNQHESQSRKQEELTWDKIICIQKELENECTVHYKSEPGS